MHIINMPGEVGQTVCFEWALVADMHFDIFVFWVHVMFHTPSINFLMTKKVIYWGVFTTKPFKDRKFSYVWSLHSNTEFIREQITVFELNGTFFFAFVSTIGYFLTSCMLSGRNRKKNGLLKWTCSRSVVTECFR